MRSKEIPRNTVDLIQTALLTETDEDLFIIRGKIFDEAPSLAMAHYKVTPDGKVFHYSFNKDLEAYEYDEVSLE